MSPWTEKRRSVWPVFLGLAVILVAMVAGYVLMTGGLNDSDGSGGHEGTTPGPISTPTDDAEPPPVVKVVSWGQSSGQLAVIVRNRSTQPIERMRVRITATDSDGATVVSTAGTAPDVCCTIVGLPPGKDFGLFAELGDTVSDIARVEVEPQSVQLGKGRAADVVASAPRFERYDGDTVVTADLTAKGRLTGYVAAQAFLTRGGRIAQVISGRFYCFGPGSSHQVRLRLFHEVPADLRLQRVVAYAVPDGVRPYVPGRCR